MMGREDLNADPAPQVVGRNRTGAAETRAEFPIVDNPVHVCAGDAQENERVDQIARAAPSLQKVQGQAAADFQSFRQDRPARRVVYAN